MASCVVSSFRCPSEVSLSLHGLYQEWPVSFDGDWRKPQHLPTSDGDALLHADLQVTCHPRHRVHQELFIVVVVLLQSAEGQEPGQLRMTLEVHAHWVLLNIVWMLCGCLAATSPQDWLPVEDHDRAFLFASCVRWKLTRNSKSIRGTSAFIPMYLHRYRQGKVTFCNFCEDPMIGTKLVSEPLPILSQDLFASGQVRMRE